MGKLAREIESRIAAEAEVYVAVEEDEGMLVLSGIVGGEGERQAALDIAASLAPDRRIEDNMELSDALPRLAGDIELAESDVAGMRGATPGLEQEEGLEPGDFTDQPLLTDPLAAAGAGPTGLDTDVVSEGGDAYVPPMDPVGGSRRLIGGFEMSSMDSVEVELSALDNLPGDEGIADAIRLELGEDAATAGLPIRVTVRRGIVRLSGVVETLDDADNAAEVASRVPGVVEVREELDVRAGRVR
jgi:osmotically-inducible protein OsmY